MAPACCLCGSVRGGFRTGTMDCPPFYLGESCPPTLILIPNTSVSPCIPLVPFKLLPRCWLSKGVSLSKSLCGFFKRNCLGLQKFLPLTQSLPVFAAKSMGVLSSWHWYPGLGVLLWGWDSSFPRYPSLIIYTTCGCGTRPVRVSTPPISLDGCGFFLIQ